MFKEYISLEGQVLSVKYYENPDDEFINIIFLINDIEQERKLVYKLKVLEWSGKFDEIKKWEGHYIRIEGQLIPWRARQFKCDWRDVIITKAKDLV